MNSKKVVLAVVLGVSAFVVVFVADGMLGGARGPTPPAAFVIMGAYLAVCQFFVSVKGAPLRANRPTMLAMATPCVLGAVLMVASESRETLLNQGLPLLLAAGLGPLLGAIVAGAFAGKDGRAEFR